MVKYSDREALAIQKVVISETVHVNQHDKGYFTKTTSGLAMRWRCGPLSNHFDHLLVYIAYNAHS